MNPFNCSYQSRYIQSGKKKTKEKESFRFYVQRIDCYCRTIMMKNKGKLQKINVDFLSVVWCLSMPF